MSELNGDLTKPKWKRAFSPSNSLFWMWNECVKILLNIAQNIIKKDLDNLKAVNNLYQKLLLQPAFETLNTFKPTLSFSVPSSQYLFHLHIFHANASKKKLKCANFPTLRFYSWLKNTVKYHNNNNYYYWYLLSNKKLINE